MFFALEWTNDGGIAAIFDLAMSRGRVSTNQTFFAGEVYTANIKIRECVNGRLKEVKNNWKSLNVRPKKWSRSLKGGGRLLEVPTVRLWLGKFWCFWLAVAYGRWSLTRGGRTWRFDCSTIFRSPLTGRWNGIVFFRIRVFYDEFSSIS